MRIAFPAGQTLLIESSTSKVRDRFGTPPKGTPGYDAAAGTWTLASPTVFDYCYEVMRWVREDLAKAVRA